MASGLKLLLSLSGFVCAQTCWRDTPCTHSPTAAFPGEWDKNIFAPSSRTVAPTAVFNLDDGKKISSLPGSALMKSDQPSIVYDFGMEVGGVVTIEFEVASTIGNGAIGIAFTEAKEWIGPVSDSSSGVYDRKDGSLFANFTSVGNHTYVMPVENLRGGFRYMTLFLAEHNTASVTIYNVSLEISFQPTWSNLRAYQGYFHSNDDLLNKIWYSGAYVRTVNICQTLQTNAIHPRTGRAWPAPDSQWLNNGIVGEGNTINTDGAKRDRTVWPGDMGVAVPSSFYSTGDIELVHSIRRHLWNYPLPNGILPFSGPELLAEESDTYHMWTMIGTYNYVLFSGDTSFIRDIWDSYLKAASFLDAQLDPSLDLINITGYTEDWGRFFVGNVSTSAQMLYYRTLTTGATLATWLGDTTGVNTTWLGIAARLQKAINARLWNATTGAFIDSLESLELGNGLYPQDGNSLAVLFGVVDTSSDQAQRISSYLTENWTPIGAESPELPGEISPFISSFEIQAHLMAGQTKRALELIRSSWGWYLNNENGTQSTMIEGYLINGTFGYRYNAGYENDFSYTSHAHGWSTGPITALTEYVVGLSITQPGGSTWQIAPQFGDLTSAQAGFTTNLGKYSASWVARCGGGYTLDYNVPEGTSGSILLPLSNTGSDNFKLLVDGLDKTNSKESVDVGGNIYREVHVLRGNGGQHHIELSGAAC
ncbi:glycoside hydrolase family 78 protein [Xylariaceae sp. FL0662B]|nr:glycoside hydrolase family 78 protein [Xylariaceae sp. FL0662B]